MEEARLIHQMIALYSDMVEAGFAAEDYNSWIDFAAGVGYYKASCLKVFEVLEDYSFHLYSNLLPGNSLVDSQEEIA